MATFISIIGFMFLFAAIDVNRKDDSKIKIFSWNWVLILVLVIAGVSIIRKADNMEKNQKIKTEQTQTNKQMTFLD